jgi:hypothetical protein
LRFSKRRERERVGGSGQAGDNGEGRREAQRRRSRHSVREYQGAALSLCLLDANAVPCKYSSHRGQTHCVGIDVLTAGEKVFAVPAAARP